MTREELQTALDQCLPYFRVEHADDGTRWHLYYNGQTIPEEHWKPFERFTGAIGFPLDFSSSLYVGVSVANEELVHALRNLTSAEVCE